ncbi:YidH family protein [Bdellovibrio sp. HCB209]|uniref:YidH family protein n=1 Tax=Bdellovibrio sp. HCB209 TaxID=3394354 RepID=UPI0039B5A64D
MIEPELNSTELSKQRTGLSEERTGLSEHRTDLSEHRTELSEHRTALSEERSKLSDVRSHLANERTHLAYMRTGISLVSLGITMNRFSWFLIDNKSMTRFGGHTFLNDAKNVGLGMVILGSALLVWSLFRYNKTVKSIDSGVFTPPHRFIWGFTLTLILIGTISTIWLMVG